MDKFFTIRFRRKTAERFKKFSKRVSKSYSESLDAMIDFFEWHGYMPDQRFGKDIIAGQEINRKRINASIAISKSIEKAQNIPLINIETMLRSLFEEEHKKYQPKPVEAKTTDTDDLKTKKEKTTVSRIKYDWTKRQLDDTHNRLKYMLEKVELVKNRFGADYLKIEITREELARFKQGLKNVE